MLNRWNFLKTGFYEGIKLYFVEYFEALFNGGMKNLWPTRAYVDLFSGPGMCIDRDTGEEFEGSPLLALGCSTPFTHHYFNDIDTELIGALEQRQQRLFPQAKVTYSNLDCNLAATSIAAQLPKGALTLAFIGAYEVTFDALASLLQGPHIDVIVTFHSTAIKRNVHQGGYVNRCVNDIRRRPSQPLIQWRFHPHTVHRDRRLRSTQGPSDA